MPNRPFFDPSNSSSSPAHDEIAALAHELWLQQGCPIGRDREHWHQAERILRHDSRINRRQERADDSTELTSTEAAPSAAPDPLRANDPLDAHGVKDRQVPPLEKALRPRSPTPGRRPPTVP